MHQRPVVFFHIGGHKTGTTYLQNVLWRNRAQLRNDGMLYPGRHRVSHIWANFDLRKTSLDGYSTPQIDGAWRRLVEEVREWHRPAIISQETFSLLKSRHIRRALRDLDFADVHVVFTARDMARQLPAAWQEWVKNQSTLTFAEFLAAVRRPTEEARRLMDLHDVPAILERWSKKVTADRIHLITVPPPGSHPGLLWERFAAMLGLEPDRYDLDIHDTNTSLGAAEVAVLRRINVELAGALSWPDYNRLVKFGLAPAMAKRPGARIALPDEAFGWAVEWAGQAVEKLAGTGYQVVGDLADLIPKTVPTGENPDCVGAEAQASAAVAALTLLNHATPRSDGTGVGDLADLIPKTVPTRENPDRIGAEARASAAIAALTQLMLNEAAPRSDGTGDRRGQPAYAARMKRAARRLAGLAKRRLRLYISIAVRWAILSDRRR